MRDPFELNVPGSAWAATRRRTPMQWDAAGNAGFTSGAPWLPLAEDYRQLNVETQHADPPRSSRCTSG